MFESKPNLDSQSVQDSVFFKILHLTCLLAF